MRQPISNTKLNLLSTSAAASLLIIAGVLITVLASFAYSPKANAVSCADVYNPIPGWLMTRINDNKSVYQQVANETGVPWEMLAAVHYREFNATVSNPHNGQGIYQLYSSGQYFAPGHVSRDGFVHQTRLAANFLQSKAVNFATKSVSPRKLTTNETNHELIKNTLFSYNGRAYTYANQSANYGFSPKDQPYEGSPYVMSKFDCQRSNMGLITTDGSSELRATDTRMGAFTLYARLKGDDFWKDLQNKSSLDRYTWEEVSKTFYTSSSKVASVNPNHIKQGQYLYLEYKIKNTSNSVWDNSVRLGTQGDRKSITCTEDWLSCNRAASLQESEVKPGEIGTIGYWLRSPSTPGVYKEYYNLVIDNRTWFIDIGSHWQIRVDGSANDHKLDANKNILKRGESLISEDRQNVMSLSPFGSLDIYSNNKHVWKAPTTGAVEQLVLQSDGNLVAYTHRGEPAWVVNGPGNNVLRITNDDKLTYLQGTTPIWEHSWAETTPTAHVSTNNILHRGQRIWSDNGSHSLVLQDDGNLVQYGSKGPIWASNTQNGLYLAQQDDGNLVLYSATGLAVWASHRSGTNVKTFIQNDGNIVSYGSRGPIWASR